MRWLQHVKMWHLKRQYKKWDKQHRFFAFAVVSMIQDNTVRFPQARFERLARVAYQRRERYATRLQQMAQGVPLLSKINGSSATIFEECEGAGLLRR